MSHFEPRPEDYPRQARIIVAALLGFGLHGVLLVHALDAPGDGWRWIFYVGYVVIFVTSLVIATRREKRWRLERDERERASRGRDDGDGRRRPNAGDGYVT